MENCLFTKLNAAVEGNDFNYLNSYRIEVSKSASPSSANRAYGFIGEERKLLLSGDAYFTDSALQQNLGQVLNVPPSTSPSSPFIVYISNNTGTLIVFDDYKATEIGSPNVAFRPYWEDIAVRKEQLTDVVNPVGEYNISDYNGFNQLSGLTDQSVSGNVSELTTLPAIQNLSVNSPNLYGEIADFGKFVNLTNLSIANANVYGEFEDLIAALRGNGKTTGAFAGYWSFGYATIYDPSTGQRVRLTSNYGTPTTGIINVSWTASTITVNGTTINA